MTIPCPESHPSNTQPAQVERILLAWGTSCPQALARARDADPAAKERLVRINALLSLLLPEGAIRQWVREPGLDGLSLLDCLDRRGGGSGLDTLGLARVEASLRQAFRAYEPLGLFSPRPVEEQCQAINPEGSPEGASEGWSDGWIRRSEVFPAGPDFRADGDRDDSSNPNYPTDWQIDPEISEAQAGILTNILFSRSRLADVEAWTLIDPSTGQPVPEPVLRLCDALEYHWSHADGVASRSLMTMAFAEQSRLIRLIAARSARQMLGHREVALALAATRHDRDPVVRLEAVRTLGLFASRMEVRRLLIGFSRDPNVDIRRSVSNVLSDKKLTAQEADILAPLVFDPDAQVSNAMRFAISPDHVLSRVRAMIADAASGAVMSDYDFYVIASCEGIDPSEREEAFVLRFAACGGSDPTSDLVQILRALRWWRDAVPVSLWQAAARVLTGVRRGELDLDRALAACAARAEGDAGWDFLMACLKSRAVRPNTSLWTDIFARMAQLASGNFNRLKSLTVEVSNPFENEDSRIAAIQVLGQLEDIIELRGCLLQVLRANSSDSLIVGEALRQISGSLDLEDGSGLVRWLEDAGEMELAAQARQLIQKKS